MFVAVLGGPVRTSREKEGAMGRGVSLCLVGCALSVAACRQAPEPAAAPEPAPALEPAVGEPAAALASWPRSSVVCSRANPPVLELSVSWSDGADKALVSNPSAELCVGGAFPNAVSWTAAVPEGYEGKVEVTFKAGACADSQPGYLSVADNDSRRVRGSTGQGVQAGACWGYDATLHVAQNGAPVTGSPFTVDPEIIWKR